MVKRMAAKQNIKVTTEDAVRWLLRHKRRIENNLCCATVEQLQDVLFDITIVGWPNPAFNRKATDDTESKPSSNRKSHDQALTFRTC